MGLLGPLILAFCCEGLFGGKRGSSTVDAIERVLE